MAMKETMGESEIYLWLRSPLCLWSVCAEEALWWWSKKSRIREEGRGLESSGWRKKEEKKSKVIPRSQSFMPASNAVNSWEEEQCDRGGGENSTVHGLDKWVGCDINSLQTFGHPHKNLCIAFNHTISQGLNGDLPHCVCSCSKFTLNVCDYRLACPFCLYTFKSVRRPSFLGLRVISKSRPWQEW